jgi:hypothetical protein
MKIRTDFGDNIVYEEIWRIGVHVTVSFLNSMLQSGRDVPRKIISG